MSDANTNGNDGQRQRLRFVSDSRIGRRHRRPQFTARHAIGKPVQGTALVANDGFSARYDLDRIGGTFSRPAHKLAGQSYVGKILVLDTAKGGVASAWMLHEMASRGMMPLAIVFNTRQSHPRPGRRLRRPDHAGGLRRGHHLADSARGDGGDRSGEQDGAGGGGVGARTAAPATWRRAPISSGSRSVPC